MTQKKSHRATQSSSANIIFKIIGGILVAAQFFTSLLFIFSLQRLNILQTWQFAAICAILALIFIYDGYKLLFSKKARTFSKILTCVVAVLISALCAFAYYYIQQANSLISSISGINEEFIYYELRAFKSDNIQQASELNGKKIGILSTGQNIEELRSDLKQEISDFELAEYETIGNLLVDFYDRNISAIVINESYLSVLEETEYALEDDTTVLHQIRYVISKEDNLRAPVDVTKEPFIVYISGSDSRSSGYAISRSDVNILAVVNPNSGKILLVNIPRDYHVQLHGTTGLKDKLTHAGLYGIDMSKNTIEDLLDIKINYTVRVGFQGVQKFVDAIGGIDIESPIAMTLPLGDQNAATGGNRKYCYYKQGMNHLDGVCALRYARERKKFANGDLDRGKHQQQVLTAIIEKISDVHYVTRYSQILDAAKDTLLTSFTQAEISDFVRWQLTELKSWKVESIQIGNSRHILTPTYTISNENLWVYLPDEESENIAKQKIAEYLAK